MTKARQVNVDGTEVNYSVDKLDGGKPLVLTATGGGDRLHQYGKFAEVRF